MKKFTFPAIVLFILLFSSCTKNDVPVVNKNLDKKLIAQTVLQGTSNKLSLYSEYDSLFVGYNPLFIVLKDTLSGTTVTNATLTLLPEMDMITMKHACPVEQPVYEAESSAYKAAAAFVMATMGNKGWKLHVTTSINGTTYTNEIPVVVKATSANIKLIASVLDQNKQPYYLVLVHPQRPQQRVGINDLEVAVYRRNTMMDFPAVDNFALTFIPTMPSMGHSSPNNQNPVFIGKGHYKGKVNFTMTGDWRLDFSIAGNGSTFADHAIIDILF